MFVSLKLRRMNKFSDRAAASIRTSLRMRMCKILYECDARAPEEKKKNIYLYIYECKDICITFKS